MLLHIDGLRSAHVGSVVGAIFRAHGGAAGQMRLPSGRPLEMPGAAAARRAAGVERTRTRSQSRHDSDEDFDMSYDPSKGMDEFAAERCARFTNCNQNHLFTCCAATLQLCWCASRCYVLACLGSSNLSRQWDAVMLHLENAERLLCGRREELEALRAEEALAQRMDELEAMEMWADAEPAPEWHSWRTRSSGGAAGPRGQAHFAAPQPPPSRGSRRRGWGNAASIAEVVMGMFAGAGPLGGRPPLLSAPYSHCL